MVAQQLLQEQEHARTNAEVKSLRLVEDFAAAKESWQREMPPVKQLAVYKQKVQALLAEIEGYQSELADLRSSESALRDERTRLQQQVARLQSSHGALAPLARRPSLLLRSVHEDSARSFLQRRSGAASSCGRSSRRRSANCGPVDATARD